VHSTAVRRPFRATVADRDRIGSDDKVVLYLDTFNDRRRAFVFGVNPLGIQEDGVLSEGSGSGAGSLFGAGLDRSPDFIWQSRGQVTDSGYVVEISIPFKSLRYGGTGPQAWGFNVQRTTRRPATKTPGPTCAAPTRASSRSPDDSRACTTSAAASPSRCSRT
jgi:hypothetical protein